MILRKGVRLEREIREKLYKHGILCFRVAGSGKSRKTPNIDLICVYKGKVFGLEVKNYSGSNKYLILRDRQLKDLLDINEHIPVYIAIKVKKYGKIYVIPINMINKKSIKLDYIEKKGILLEHFVEMLKSNKLFLV